MYVKQLKEIENRPDESGLSDLTALIGGLVHEIKNPLSTISVNLQLLREEILDDATEKGKRIQKKIQVLQKESTRLEEILNDFLRFAKEQALELKEQDINTVVDEVLDFIGPEAQLQSIKILKLYDSSLPKCRIDVNLLKQAILNICINAQEAMPDGGELTVRTMLNEHTVQIDIEDTGVGIHAENIEKIFNLYFSTKKTGTGLGLPTTKKIIERHNGTLTVESKEGEGTRFSILLPAIDN